MTFISYAQNYEDVMLWRALKDVKNGFYIDVGAAWPQGHSVTHSFYLEGWRGINIEPNSKFFDQLQSQRSRDINLPFAISDKCGSFTMHLIEETGLSTLDKDIAIKHGATGIKSLEKQVDTHTLAFIWEKYVPPDQEIHFLKIDVEGLEKAVLAGNDWANCRPWIILVEAAMPMSQVESHDEWEELLISADYQFAYADGLNRFYVAQEHSELLAAFKYPPNVFDAFIPIAQQQADSRANNAEVKAAESEARTAKIETKFQQLTNELNSVYHSKSWRITKPIRILANQVLAVKNENIVIRIKKYSKQVTQLVAARAIKYIERRGGFRKYCIDLSKTLGLYNFLRLIYHRNLEQTRLQRLTKIKQNLSATEKSEHLSTHARSIHIDLNKAVKKHQKESC
ncbi:MAG: FkbM family methyltransferase [Pseudomonadales bacterium]|nr:FkbM family methyltransferase [Pseudomonadales bacterium]